MIAAIAPDFDILIAVVRGGDVDYKNRRSHSAGATVAAGLLCGGLSRLVNGRFLRGALRGSAAYASHIVLDYFGKEAEDGLPLLWPLSDQLYAAPHPVFGTIYSRRGHFIRGLLTKRNLYRIRREVAIIFPAVLAAEVISAIARR